MNDWSKAVSSCVFFCAAGPALMFLNKHIISQLDFRFPILITFLGMGSSGLIARCVLGLGLVEPKSRGKSTPWESIVPIGVLNGLTIWTGNLAYVELSVAFIQVQRPPLADPHSYTVTLLRCSRLLSLCAYSFWHMQLGSRP